jgi:oligopeptide/dipeptide ABC transporter ATP-binding protein
MATVVGPGAARPLLEVRSLRTEFQTDAGVVHAVRDVSFTVSPGEVLGIVGESGSGKSVTMLSVMGLIPSPPGQIVGGEVLFEGRDLLRLPADALRRVRGSEIGMIFQEPLSSLNPVLTIGDQLDEAIRVHKRIGKAEARRHSLDMLGMVNIASPERVVDDYPHQLSGGMCQRVMLAVALACRPKLLIADEPTTALDISTQDQLLELVRQLQRELGLAVVWITHDLGIIAGLADRVVVMYAGEVMEQAAVDDLYDSPAHPYTVGLLDCVPTIVGPHRSRLSSIPGAPPDLVRPPEGCPFEPRCAWRIDRCATHRPGLEGVAPGHVRACWVPVATVRAGAPSAARIEVPG